MYPARDAAEKDSHNRIPSADRLATERTAPGVTARQPHSVQPTPHPALCGHGHSSAYPAVRMALGKYQSP